MKIKSEVFYFDSLGHEYPATVVEVVGAGPSGFKTLDLAYSTKPGSVAVVASVPHVTDRENSSSGYWTLTHDEPIASPEPTEEPAPEIEMPTWMQHPEPETEL